jgi:hypothetical protein
MKSLCKKYNGLIVFATLIKNELVSVQAQLDNDNKIEKNIYQEKIYKTSDLIKALNHYIKTIL